MILAGSRLLNWLRCDHVALNGSESRAACANFVAGSGGMLPSMVKSSMAELKVFLILFAINWR